MRRGSSTRSCPARARRAIRCLVLFVFAVCALLLTAPAIRAQTESYSGAEVAELVFEGNTVFDHGLLRGAIATQATRCSLIFALAPVCWLGFAVDRYYLSEPMLEFDTDRLRIFYAQRGYRYATTTVRVEPLDDDVAPGPYVGDPEDAPRVRVVFTIDAGTPVRVASLEITGLEELDDPAVVRDLPLQPGRELDQTAYEATRDSLLTRLRNRGYAHAEALGSIDIDASDPYSARVRLDVFPGARARFGEIRIVGTDRVDPAVVRRMLTFQPGDVYRSAELLRSQRNLFGLEVFRHAAISEELGQPTDTLVPVQVEVSEGDLHRIRLGTGLSTAECVNAEGRWTSRNFLGGARRLEFRGRVANVLAGQLEEFPCFDTGTGEHAKLTGFLGLDFTQPWLFSPANTFGAGVFAERRSLPNVFVRTAAGAYVSLVRSLRQGSVAVGYRPELTRLDAADLIFCVSFVVCELSDIQVLQSAHWLAPLAITVVRDRSNSVFAPTRGDVVRLESEYASSFSGSDFAYVRLAGEVAVYREVTPGLVLASRIRSGFARSIRGPQDGDGLGVHPQKRFFGGGPNSVRGYAQSRLGPQVLTADAVSVLLAPAPDGAGCTEEQINTGTCDASSVPLDRFDAPRPVGGAALFEGNAEARIRLGSSNFTGAVFLDFGQVWSEVGDFDLSGLAWAPGVGVRYFSPIGPIRVDVGYSAAGAEKLPVITTEVENGVSTGRLRSQPPILWNPRRTFLDRLQLHISIGQAF